MAPEVISCFLIDDDPEEHEIFDYALQQLNLAVDCRYFKSARLAIEAAKASGVKLPSHLFVDMNMPGSIISKELGDLQHMFPYPETKIAVYSSVFPTESLRKLTGAQNLTYCFKQPTVDKLSVMLSEHFRQQNRMVS